MAEVAYRITMEWNSNRHEVIIKVKPWDKNTVIREDNFIIYDFTVGGVKEKLTAIARRADELADVYSIGGKLSIIREDQLDGIYETIRTYARKRREEHAAAAERRREEEGAD